MARHRGDLRSDAAELASIGPAERKMRRRLGIGVLVLGTFLSWVLASRESDVTWWWAVVFFAVYLVGSRLVLDGQTGTCPLKSELGQRNLRGPLTVFGDPISDEQLAGTLRHLSRRAWLFAVVAAVLLAAVSMWSAAR